MVIIEADDIFLNHLIHNQVDKASLELPDGTYIE